MAAPSVVPNFLSMAVQVSVLTIDTFSVNRDVKARRDALWLPVKTVAPVLMPSDKPRQAPEINPKLGFQACLPPMITLAGQGDWTRRSNCPWVIRRQAISMPSWFPPEIAGPERPLPGRPWGRARTAALSLGSAGGSTSPPQPSPPSDGGEGVVFWGTITQGCSRDARLPWAIIFRP